MVASDISAHRYTRQFDEFGALHLVPLAASPAELDEAIREELVKGRSEPSGTVPSWESVAQCHFDLYESLM